jgi:hypothetical protein
MNYKNSITGEIISFFCYQKLAFENQQNYSEVRDNPTHTVNEYNDEFMLYILPSNTNYAMIGGLNDSCGGAHEGF